MKEQIKEHKPNIVKPVKKDSEKKAEDGFRKVTREEWDKMSKKEKKQYLKERKKRKQKVFGKKIINIE